MCRLCRKQATLIAGPDNKFAVDHFRGGGHRTTAVLRRPAGPERTRRATAAARPPAPPERAVTTPPPTPTHDGAQELLCDPPRDCRHASSLDPPRDPMFLDLALRHAELLAKHKGWPPRQPCSRSTCCARGHRADSRTPTGSRANRASAPTEITVRIREPTGPCAFDSFLCRPGKEGAHEKGAAWKKKSARFRRRHLTPVPRAASLAELNQMLAPSRGRLPYPADTRTSRRRRGRWVHEF